MDTGDGVAGDGHVVGGLLPHADLIVVQVQAPYQLRVGGAVVLPQLFDRIGGAAQVEPRHHIGIEVVVDHGGVLIGPGDTVNVKTPVGFLAGETQVNPHAGGLDENVDPLAFQEPAITGCLQVLGQGVGDIGVDMVLRRPGRVIGRRLDPVPAGNR